MGNRYGLVWPKASTNSPSITPNRPFDCRPCPTSECCDKQCDQDNDQGIRNLRKATVSEQEASKISGHKTGSVFERYNIMSAEDVTAAIEKVETASLNGVDTGIRKPARST